MRATKTTALIAMLAIGFLASCQDASGPGANDLKGGPLMDVVTTELASGDAVPLKNPNKEDTWAWGMIDGKGGKVRLDGHELMVPNGSVSEPTAFIIVERAGEYLVVDLLAYRQVGEEWIPVTTFDSPVKLKLSYRGLDIRNPNRLTILYLPDDVVTGRKEIIPSKVDKTSENVAGKLDHFSSYSAGIN